VLDRDIVVAPDGSVTLGTATAEPLEHVVDQFSAHLHARQPVSAT
jgi:hypothetical protein